MCFPILFLLRNTPQRRAFTSEFIIPEVLTVIQDKLKLMEPVVNMIEEETENTVWSRCCEGEMDVKVLALHE